MSSRALHAYRLLIADVYDLAGASRASSESLARRHGCTAAQWHLLSVVSEAEMTVSAAAKRLGLSRQAVQRVANDLLRSGHLSARRNPVDRRAPLVSLTEAGRTTLRQLFDGSDDVRDALLQRAGVGLEDLQQARSTLQHLIAAYGPAHTRKTMSSTLPDVRHADPRRTVVRGKADHHRGTS